MEPMNTTAAPQSKPFSPELQADIDRWQQAEREKRKKLESKGKAIGTFDELKAALKAAFEQLPENVELPFHLTPQGQRFAKFKVLLQDSPEFLQKIDRTKLSNQEAFDAVAKWDGEFPGPIAFGATGAGK